ncbi:hypothetical protein CIB95_07290 [Lottiidibacillus patelloidae]|uniref:Uncharacterized protein n=1 Tax=Lottiidibacillus patelloidae TaxID=2670334 RepID=A0A263BU67_9BACI|nr:hypothetical protein [Lottiidibacillus patelloidae]OZM57260.1 hypothetical protein CIB95_07290 [Lottiidibacillus patelloidae]
MKEIDGILFLWLAWIIWVVATFLFRRSKERYLITVVALLSIIFSHTYVELPYLTINIAMLFLMLLGCYIVAKSTILQRCYLFIVSSILMMAYVAILAIHLFDPVWFLLNKKFVIVILCSFILLLLCRDMKQGLAVLFIGVNVGDIIFSLVIYNIHLVTFQQPLFALDVISLSITFTYIFNTYFNTVSSIQKSSMKSSKRGRALL